MNLYSLQLVINDTVDGHLVDYEDFGLTDAEAVINYLQIVRISTGTMSIKFSTSDDWILIASAMYPYIFNTVKFDEFWLKPSESLTVDLIANFIPTNYVVSS